MVIIPNREPSSATTTPIAVIIICLFVFYVYLANKTEDDLKLQTALTAYQEHAYFELEWPLYTQFLAEHHESTRLDQVQEWYRLGFITRISEQMLARVDFYRYLRIDRYDYFQSIANAGWFYNREEINNKVLSMSHYRYGLMPNKFSWFSLLTHSFVHNSFIHLTLVLFSLLLFGSAIEIHFGRIGFLGLYFTSNVCGGLMYWLLQPGAFMPLIGSSAAVLGLLVAFIALYQMQKARFFYWVLFQSGNFVTYSLVFPVVYLILEGSRILVFGDNATALSELGGLLVGLIALILILTLFRSKLIMALQPTIEASPQHSQNYNCVGQYQQDLEALYQLLARNRFVGAKKLLMSMLSDYGETFSLAFVRYNLEKHKNTAIRKANILKLLSCSDFSGPELKRFDKIWKESAVALNELNESDLFKAAKLLSQVRDPSSAAAICDHLYAMNSKNAKLVTLAEVLASAFAETNQLNKKERYERLAASIQS